MVRAATSVTLRGERLMNVTHRPLGPSTPRYRGSCNGERRCVRASAVDPQRLRAARTSPTWNPRISTRSCRILPNSRVPTWQLSRTISLFRCSPPRTTRWGGIPTNNDTEVYRNSEETIPGLYAAGEAACVGARGKPLGTNSRWTLTFGKRAGRRAAVAASSEFPVPDDAADRTRNAQRHP